MKKDNKKNVIIAVLSTLVAVFVILMIVGLAMPEENQYVGESVQDSFVNACAEEDGDYAGCLCMYDTIIENYGMEGFYEMADHLEETGELNDQGWKAIQACY